MALDPNIILATQPVKLPDQRDLLQLRNLAQQGQAQELQLKQAQKADADAQTLADIYRRNTKTDGTLDSTGVMRDMGSSGLGEKIPAYQKQNADLQTALAEHGIKSLDQFKKRTDIINGTLSSLLTDQNLTHDKVISAISGLVDHGVITNDQGAQMVRELPGPEQLRPFLVSKALESVEVGKRLDSILPKAERVDTGGVILTGTTNPQTGVFTKSGEINKTATPGEKLTNDRLGAGGVSLSPAAIDLAAQRLLNGEPANKVLANFGRGAQGARDIAAVQNRFAELASLAGADATEIALRNQELTSEARTRLELGAREGKIAPRVQEALNFANIAKEASAKVPRGNFIPWNKLSQMTDTQMSDPNLAAMKAATLSLINAYAAAVGGGTPTVHDKDEAEKVLNNAQSPEAYNAVVDQLIRETQAALASPRNVMEEMRGHTKDKNRERDAGVPAATASGASVSSW